MLDGSTAFTQKRWKRREPLAHRPHVARQRSPRSLDSVLSDVTKDGTLPTELNEEPFFSSIAGNTDVLQEDRLIDEVLKLDPRVLKHRQRTLKRVERAIQSHYGNKYTVEMFGSACYGVSLPHSDLDLVIIDPDRPRGHDPQATKQKVPPIYNVKKIARVLRAAGFQEVLAIPWAKVPIVKFQDCATGLSCDINVNDLLGLYNSQMIKTYCDLSPDLRRMLAFIKLWSRSRGLNTPSPKAGGGPASFSSYAFALMTIGFLQKRSLLPNLQADLPQHFPRNYQSWICVAKGKPSELCDTRFAIPAGWERPSASSLKDLMLDWFKFWSHEFSYDKETLCIRGGGCIPRSPTEAMSVMSLADPFIRSKNVTRNIHAKVMATFFCECKEALRVLEEGGSLDAVLDVVIRY